MDNEYNKNAARDLLSLTTVEEIMSSPVNTLGETEAFSEVEKMFVSKGIRHLPIVDKNKKLVGIITQKDLYKLISPRKAVAQTLEYDRDKILDGDAYYSKEVLDAYILRHIMAKKVHTVGIKDTVGAAAHSIVSNSISSVVVVDEEKKVIGIVTTCDIMKSVDRVFIGGE